MSQFFVSYDHPAPDGFQDVNLNSLTLDGGIDDGEAIELVVVDVLCRFHEKEHFGVINKLCRKLRRGGTLRLGFVDINWLAKHLSMRRISPSEFNSLAFGANNRAVADMEAVMTYLSRAGMDFGRMYQHTDHRFYIIATKG